MIYVPDDDSYLLRKQVKKFAKDKAVLDMGTGSGILAIDAKKAGARSVQACDINQEVVDHVKNLGISVVKSNLFSNIKDTFDLIIFNPPYLPKDNVEDKESARITSGGKYGDEIIIRFLNQAKEHLNKEGIILLLLSSLTPRKKILSILKKNKMSHSLLSEKNLFFEKLEVWCIK